MGNSHVGWKSRLVGLVQISLVVVVVGSAVMFARAPSAEDAAKPAFTRKAEAETRLVSVIRPEPALRSVNIEATGNITVRNYVSMTPEVSGKIVTLAPALRSGGVFSAGEVLLEIDATDFRLALAQARAEVDSARASLELQQAESQAAISNYRLLHANEEVPPLVAKLPQIERAKAQLAAAEARLDIAQTDLQRTRFSLPFSGKVVATSAEVGQLLTRGQNFGRAFAMDAVEAAVPITLEDLARLEPVVGRKATLTVQGRDIVARVERVAAELEQRTRFSKLYLSLDDQLSLAPGTFVNVSIDGPELANTLTIPTAAEQGDGILWVVDNGELRQYTPVVRGFNRQGYIVDAFDFGEGIVTGAVPGGREGLKVKLAEATL